ncbi:hypothetical protein E6W39_05035 [Kitasatospora acidiphila]|uniref:Uncharacterized protein n=1 Tax=Kitasatospora acidiphila TaxID=2567942 RepID=A0A540VY83_9ACTN|nr:NAD(P)-binding protein [Kitasatospora acidiphila]TQF01728.1 hypothetical protein E6W39_05035 [Kitasatospora acidiphila]
MRAGRQVTVIGTGTAGLVTVAELECHGCQVEILEADHRIGGGIPACRFHSGYDTPSVKRGAMRISEHHRQTLARIECPPDPDVAPDPDAAPVPMTCRADSFRRTRVV